VIWAVPGNHCVQSPASECVVSPENAIGHCKVNCSLCSVQQERWSLHWVLLRQGYAGGL